VTERPGPTEPVPIEPPTDPDRGRPELVEERRPLIERIGMAGIAVVMAGLFGTVAVAAWVGGDAFLSVMAAIGCLMTAWVGALTLLRG
jgi:hypothetical protein